MPISRLVRCLLVVALAASLTPALALAQARAQDRDACAASIDLGQGKVDVYVPASYDPDNPLPLIVMPHPFTWTGHRWAQYLGFADLAESRGFIYVAPDGTVQPGGVSRFWNATPASCDTTKTGVDHSGYLWNLVEALQEQCAIDPRRVYFAGGSCGGFMSHRMACDHADGVAAIVSVMGATYNDPGACRPTSPVHVLDLRATEDSIIRYEGGVSESTGKPYPSAERTALTWANLNGCDPSGAEIPGDTWDIIDKVEGAETWPMRYERGCQPGGSVELWTLEGSDHMNQLTDAARVRMVDYLLSHAKPGACTGKEQVKAASCKNGTLKVKLRGAEGGARYRVEVTDGPLASGNFNRRGRHTARLTGLPVGPLEALVQFDCGVTEQIELVCEQ